MSEIFASPDAAVTVRFLAAPVLVAGYRKGIWRDPAGAVEELPATELVRRARETPPILCHGPLTATRLGADPFSAFDVLELFAFVRPARFTVPTPAGLMAALDLPPPADTRAAAHGIAAAVGRLFAELQAFEPDETACARAVAEFMGRAGWRWAEAVMAALPAATPSPSGLRVWDRLQEWQDYAPPLPPRDMPVTGDEAARHLERLLGPGSEERPRQRDYAAAVAGAFRPRADEGAPRAVLAEAGTGIGKTAGYLAPAGLWARRNDWPVWISTYTKNLQHQLDHELDRLYPTAKEKAQRTVIRKGRENYLCLLNYEEMLNALPREFAGADGVAFGLVARWVMATRAGDMVGGDFPNWLAGLLGRRATLDLTDNRGECTYSACPHYRRCFIEHAIRRARRAHIVVANHALVMVQAALGGMDDSFVPTRYVFDEGHHLFDAADSAFSSDLTGIEARELRRWLIGAERSARRGRHGPSRARGLESRVGDLVADDEAARAAMAAIREAAHHLPAEGWLQRLSSGSPEGPFEGFLAEVRRHVRARAVTTDGPYSLEAEVHPVEPELMRAARDLDRWLGELALPLGQLGARLIALLEAKAGELETRDRLRLEAVIRGIRRRAESQVLAWRDMLKAITEGTPEAFVDWFAIQRADGRETDIGMHRHWLDPTLPFAETLLKDAHGVVVTSATLRDSEEAEDQGWTGALARTGLAHLVEPPQRLSVPSPFDYAANTRVIVVTDVTHTDPAETAGALRELFMVAGGGALGLFTAIRRLRQVYARLAPALEAANLPLYAQHVDQMDTSTLVDIFRAERDACLLGTDALRDGIDVPGDALRLIVFERVPWPRPDVLHRRRRAAFGGSAYDDAIVRLRLKQAFGRLVRRASDRGVFVMLDSRLPSRLLSAFPPEVEVRRMGIAEAVDQVRAFLSP